MATRTPIRHGEILLRPVDSVPHGALVRRVQVTSCIIGHSESGHHHVLESDAAFELIVTARRAMFVDLPESTRLRHLKAYQQHRELQVPAGMWQVIRKTEFDIRGSVAARRAVCD
jgi:hypothetical protein